MRVEVKPEGNNAKICFNFLKKRDNMPPDWAMPECVFSYNAEIQPPNAVTDFNSTTHPEEENWYKSKQPVFKWSKPGDPGGSGVNAYFLTGPNSSDQTVTRKIATTAANVNYSWPYVLQDGEYEFSLVARDVIGNYSDSVSRSLKIDTIAPYGAVAIAGGAEVIDTANVMLNFTASDADSGVEYARYGKSTSDFGDWEDYSVGIPYTLSETDVDGVKISVCAQFMDKSKNAGSENNPCGNISAIVSDSIWLDSIPPNNENIVINPQSATDTIGMG